MQPENRERALLGYRRGGSQLAVAPIRIKPAGGRFPRFIYHSEAHLARAPHQMREEPTAGPWNRSIYEDLRNSLDYCRVVGHLLRRIVLSEPQPDSGYRSDSSRR